MSIETGTRIGRYEIQSLLGAGGMGEVYRALDTELKRPVALKFLHPEVASEQKRMNRFIQEARAVSALNHPNILTVYEIGEADGRRFFATEFVDGVTLRQHLMTGKMKLIEVLDVAIQIASALVAAHAAGIIHRDIKPENVMIRRDRIVKVLDFGLAKLTEQSPSIDTEAATRALVNTDPGAVMGTVSYMSPEQASGRGVDARTDIWSLGCVLYEMVTGHVPFEGATPSHVIVAILEKEPLPIQNFVPDAPEALEWIITEALTKEREERTQTAREMLKKLQRLKQRLEASAELERSVAPNLSSDSAMAPPVMDSSSVERSTTEAAPVTTARGAMTVTTVSSAEYLVGEVRRHKKGVTIALSLLVVVAAGLVYGLYKLAGRKDSSTSERKLKITRIVTGLSGIPGSVSISPDGKYIAYSLFEAGKSSLWIRQVSQSASLQIIPPVEQAWFSGTTFSRDGELIYFVGGNAKTNTLGSLYQVPVLGGREPKKILDHVSGQITLSPDEKQFAFVRINPTNRESSLMIANTDGTGEPRTIASRKGKEIITPRSLAWSPDGKMIAFGMTTTTGGFFDLVMGIPAEGGAEKQLTQRKWLGSVSGLKWLKDGSGLLLSANERGPDPSQIWLISYPDGEASKVTNDLNDYGEPSLTADSSTLATVLSEWSSKIWLVAPNEDESRARRITNGKRDGSSGLSFAPDGRIVYMALTGENMDVWVMNGDGTNSRPLTSDAYTKGQAQVSADGRYIVFMCDRPDNLLHIWRMDADGGNPKQLTRGAGESSPACSPDGRWVLFSNVDTEKPGLWKVPIDGGEVVQVTDKPLYAPVFSPDGKLISGYYYDEKANPPRGRPALISFDTGELVRVLDFPTTSGRPIWTRDGRDFLYVDHRGGVGNIWTQPASGGTAKQLTKFSSEFISGFDISPDGKQFAISRSTGTNDIILIKDFR